MYVFKSYCKAGDLLGIVQLKQKFQEEMTETNLSPVDMLSQLNVSTTKMCLC